MIKNFDAEKKENLARRFGAIAPLFDDNPLSRPDFRKIYDDLLSAIYLV